MAAAEAMRLSISVFNQPVASDHVAVCTGIVGGRAVMPLEAIRLCVKHLVAMRRISELGIAIDAAAVAEMHFIGTIETGITAHGANQSGVGVDRHLRTGGQTISIS